MKLSKKLSEMTETFVDEFLSKSQLVQKTRQGLLTPYQVGLFAHNITMLVKNTPKNLATAIENSVGDNKVLKSYFEQKRDEEVGHDKWGENDLKRIEKDFGVRNSYYVTPSMQTLIQQLDHVSSHALPSYVGYIFYVEYLTVIAAPEWIQELDEKCGIAPRYISIVGNHVELDKDHVETNIEELDEIQDHLGDHQRIEGSVAKAIKCFREFYQHVADAQQPAAADSGRLRA